MVEYQAVSGLWDLVTARFRVIALKFESVTAALPHWPMAFGLMNYRRVLPGVAQLSSDQDGCLKLIAVSLGSDQTQR